MELRVWFDGIPRVVCGITKETTCRDVVIILARAARQTGRFTLIERWRNIERPLAPLENPLLILQKWGEHAGDVQLLLSRSDKKRLSGWTKGQQGLRECFVHSFSPPPPNHREFGIKRSLTFSGSRNCFSPPCKKKEVVRKKLQKELAPAGFESKTGSHSSMHLKDPALKKPVPVQRSTVLKPKVRQPGKAIGTVSPLQNSLSPFSGSSEKSHGLLPQQISNQSDSLASKQARSNQIYENISSIQSVYSIKESGVRDPGVHGPEAEFEEYDLDKNLPPSSGKLQQQDVIEDHEMEQDESSKEAMLNLVHLVSIQQARMKFQETQINDLDSEISLLEANNFELDDADLDAEEDFVQFQNLEQEYKEQLLQLDGDALNSELSSEKEHEVVLKSGVKDVQFQLSRCEHELSQMQEKICGLEQEVQQLVAEEVGRTKQVVTEQLLEYDRNKDSLEDLQQELEDLESTIEEKKSQVASLVSELKEANLGELQQQQPGKCADSGEVVLRLLEKHMLSSHHHGTHQKSSSFDGRLEAIGTGSTQCNDGVWV